MEKKNYYITTAIAYTSGKPHIGNTYEIVLADSIARYKRFQGYNVRFQTGTDEHGQKIELKAEAAGVTPKQYVDNVAGEIKRIWDLMNTSYDKFIRTTDEYHEKQVQKIFKKLYDKGDIYKGHYEGMYCTPCESFWTESQLVDGKCPDCGRECKPAKEEAYFFKMSKYADRLIDYINTHPEFIQPVSRKNEMMNNFLLPGLQDLCVSRTSFKWGIPVDFDDRHGVFFGCAITLYGVFAIPTNMGKTAQYAWFFICYTLLNAVFYTANNIAYAALTSLVTKNSKERVQMGSFRFMFSFATNLAIQSITVGAVELLGNGAAAWRIIALIYCVIGIITNTLAVFSVKELPEEELKSNSSTGFEDDKLTFKQTVKLLFANKYFSMICVIYILQQLRAAMVNVGIFFMTYVLLNKNFEQPFYQLKYRSHN